ncbi:MarC family protein [Cetobacterium sp. SF1]|uniref:MarC family protein n=1 Tax=unclassified Cetobacterium TaxID=2630983 RepID=UPI003CE8D53C
MEAKDLILHIITNVLTMIGILNPFGNVPLFMSLTQHQKPEIRKKIYNTVVLAGFGIVTGFTLVGNFFMTYLYKIGMNELRVAGGVILIIVALRNLLGFTSASKGNNDGEMTVDEAVRFAVTPLTFPILVGPGTISTVMIIRKEAGFIVTLGAIAITFGIIKFLFSISNIIDKIFGEVVLFIISRVLQIFIMSVGVKLMITGLKNLFFN